MNLEQALELRKAKYLKRTGSPGKYKYFYKQSKGTGGKRKKETKKMSEKEVSRAKDDKKDYINDIIGISFSKMSESDFLEEYNDLIQGNEKEYESSMEDKVYESRVDQMMDMEAEELVEEMHRVNKGKQGTGGGKKEKKGTRESGTKKDKTEKVYEKIMGGDDEHSSEVYEMIEAIVEDNPEMSIKELIEEAEYEIGD